MFSYSLVCTMPWDFTTAPTSRQLRFHLTFQGVTIQPHAFGASNSASQPKQLRFRLTFPAVSVQLHSPGSLSPSSLNSASQSKQSQSRQSQLRLTVQAVTVLAIPIPPHSTIQIKYSFPSSLIFCRDFWILMRILSGTPAILFSICSATIS